ncbi:hypothetical protein B5X24_HaOG214919 [Helicoverpa armigera]|nr:hypothetical protein B5X24_HaOG214919 [Helicoverpa armigera]
MYCTTLYLLFTIFIKENNCKHQGLRIIGGTDAIEADFPYIAKYEYLIHIHKEPNRVENEHVCSGSVLTPTWSLTAAHCLDIKRKKVGKRFTVIPIIRYGTLESNAISNVLFSFTHPAYKHTRLNTVENDIGLVQTENIPLKQYGRVSALDFITMVGQQATVAGFGLTNSSDGTVDSTTKLKKPLQLLDVVVVHCKDNGLKPALCLARRCGKSSGVCPGDSGGPMLHASGIVGVNSIGPDDLELFCSMNETGPIYDAAGVTPTSPFIDWISNTINGHDKPGETKHQIQRKYLKSQKIY